MQPETLRKNLDELEYVISEINAEQKYLLLRLRRVMEEYFKLLKRIGVTINHQLAADHISHQIKLGFTEKNKGTLPYSVKRRPSYEELLRRFDIFVEQKQISAALPKTKPGPSSSSLVKPKEEILRSASLSNMPNVKSNDDNPNSQVNRSRLNLRQALSKVIIQSSNSEIISSESSTSAIKKKPINNIVPIDNKKSNSDSNSSSEESHECSPERISEEGFIVADTQASFLSHLGLCHKEYAANLPRKSKRKRRCVQSSDKPDFLYGHIDFDVSLFSNSNLL